jgi:cell division protein FtsB
MKYKEEMNNNIKQSIHGMISGLITLAVLYAIITYIPEPYNRYVFVGYLVLAGIMTRFRVIAFDKMEQDIESMAHDLKDLERERKNLNRLITEYKEKLDSVSSARASALQKVTLLQEQIKLLKKGENTLIDKGENDEPEAKD